MHKVLAASPAWASTAALVTVALVPLLVSGGYAAFQHFGDGPADPVDPVNRSSVYEDTDRDGLPNLLENYVHGTDPNASRTYSSVVPDGYLARHGYDPGDPGAEAAWAAYPPAEETPDAWGSGPLPPSHRVTVKELYTWDRPDDYDENASGPWDNGLDPTVWRSPSGLPVSWLLAHDLDPLDGNVSERVLAPTPEGDGLTVRESYRTATDPRIADTDGDGLDDDRELELSLDPSAFSTAGGGVGDGWALAHGLNASDPRMPFRDEDADGLTNAQEFNASVKLYGRNATLDGTSLDPTSQATGGAPIPDGWLVQQGLDPLQAGVAQQELGCASGEDVPRDVGDLEDVCLTVADAYRFQRPDGWDETEKGPWMGGLSARTNDTDGDGVSDAVELRGWFVNVSAGLGSGSEAERTHVTPDPLSTDTDADGLGDRAEFLGRTEVAGSAIDFNVTDPENRDTDYDGLSDGRETVTITQKLADAGDVEETLDPTVRDTDGDAVQDGREWFLLSDRADRCRNGSEYGFTNPASSPSEILKSVTDATGATLPDEAESVCAFLEPWADLDGDGRPTILDRDGDEDTLWDGWEAVPATYDQSPWASVHPRSRTDLANPDSDGDTLPDGWEVEHGEWNRTLQGFNLDPARWSSFGDEVSDADRDLDGDSITWPTFHRNVDGFERKEHDFGATNAVEYRNGTDPNEASTSGTALLDGWTIFWGRVYPELGGDAVGDVHPGSPGPFFVDTSLPRPNPVSGENPTLGTESAKRFSTEQDPGPGESLVRVFEDVQTADGETIDVHLFERSIERTFVFEQGHRTNPYLADTDGDGAPDAWEVAVDDSGPPFPLVHEGDADEDGDGLPLALEHDHGTDPSVADTDLGGVDDGEEVDAGRVPLDPSDDVSISDSDADVDCDGIEDVRETDGWEHNEHGEVTTKALVPDTDRDGLLDGASQALSPTEDTQCVDTLRTQGVLHRVRDDGRILFLGEDGEAGHPRRASTVGDGVPDGYRVWWGFKATDEPSDLLPAYEATRPSWWTEETMGPWMWGPSPEGSSDVDGDGRTDWVEEGSTFTLQDVDLDEDGLNDVNGEDPTPGARPRLSPPEGWPTATGTTAKETRHTAATFGVPLAQRPGNADRDRDGDGVRDANDQLSAVVRQLSIEGVDRDDGRYQLSQTSDYTVTGRVLVEGEEGLVPASNATVIAEVVDHDHPVGAAFTDAEGRFEVNASLAGTKEVPVPEGLVLRGRTGETVRWNVDLGDLPRGSGTQDTANELRVWVTNTSGAAKPGDPTYLGVDGALTRDDGSSVQSTAAGIEGTVSDALPISLVTATELSIDVPSEARPGERIPVGLSLADTGGTGLPNETVTVSAVNETWTVVTDETGTASVNVTVPSSLSNRRVEASYEGGPFTLPATAEETVLVKEPTELRLSMVEPTPATAGGTVTVEGRLLAPGGPGKLELDVSAGDRSVTTLTRADGSFVTNVSVGANGTGMRTLTVSFGGNPDLMETSASTELRILGGSRLTLTADRGTAEPGDTVSLRARLTDAQGTPLGDRDVHLTGLPSGGETELLTDPTGVASTEVPTPSVPGSWQVTATFDGSSERSPSRAFAWINASESTLVNLQLPDPVSRGSVVELSGSLRTASGTPIAGEPVNVTTDEDELGVALTDDAGTFALDWRVDQDVSLGKTNLRAVFNGSTDGRYQPSAAVARTTIVEGLALSPERLELNHGTNSLTLEIRLDSGEPAPDGRLTLRIDSLDVELQEEVTDATATARFAVPEEARLGQHRVHVSFDAQGPIPPSTVNTTATVVSPVEIAGVSSDVATPGSTIHLEGRLEPEQSGRPPEGLLEVSFLGIERDVQVADGRFLVNLTVPENATAGDHDIELRWPRQDPFLETKDQVPVTVRHPVEIEADLEPGGTDDPVEGSVVVRTADGEPVVEESILLETGDGLAFLVRTDDEGRARFVLPPPGPNGTDYSFHFAGRGSLAEAHTQSSVSPSTAPTTNPLVVGATVSAILLVLVAAGAFYVRRRRRQLAETVAEDLEEGGRRLEAGSEYEAAILHVYQTFLDLLASQDIELEDPDTLREFQERVERVLGIEGAAVDELFTVFEGAFYGPGEPGQHHRDQAIRAFRRTATLLREQLPDDEVIS